MRSKKAYTGGVVPFWEKVSFGIGGMCNDFMGNVIMVLAMPIFNIGLGLDARLVGIALSIPKFWDAITDPVMGNISDNTRFRFGRRKPYMLAGSFFGGLLFALIWMASPAWSQTMLFFWLTGMAILFYTAYTVFIVPCNGLASELTMDVDERTRVMAYRSFFAGIAGLITPWAYKLCFVIFFGETEVEAVKWVGVIFGLLIIVTGAIPALACKENPAGGQQDKIKILKAIKETLKNRPFLLIVGMVFFILMGIFLVQPMALYIGIYYLFDGDKAAAAKLGGVAGTMYAVSGIAATPLVAWIGTKFGKRRTLLVAQVVLIISSLLSWVLYTPESPYMSLICMAMMSPGMACVWILLGSMLADACDYDQLNTGLRREGMYGAMYSWFLKAAIAGVIAVSGFLVAWSGVDPELKIQSVQTVTRMRVLFALTPPVFYLIALVCTWFYPLSEERMHEVRAELDARKAVE
jgi:GPH family glycoside/pentoside/hexuronide:cation symporter